jgi:hypothetical protein
MKLSTKPPKLISAYIEALFESQSHFQVKKARSLGDKFVSPI